VLRCKRAEELHSQLHRSISIEHGEIIKMLLDKVVTKLSVATDCIASGGTHGR
jgi:hypothetical protein